MTDAPELLPCPICGNPTPDIMDEAFGEPINTPLISCTNVLFVDDAEAETQTCPFHGEGYENWNRLAGMVADRRAAAVAAALEEAAERVLYFWEKGQCTRPSDIRALIPADATAALAARDARVYQEALEAAINATSPFQISDEVTRAIRALPNPYGEK